jgi:hypothetical protein
VSTFATRSAIEDSIFCEPSSAAARRDSAHCVLFVRPSARSSRFWNRLESFTMPWNRSSICAMRVASDSTSPSVFVSGSPSFFNRSAPAFAPSTRAS